MQYRKRKSGILRDMEDRMGRSNANLIKFQKERTLGKSGGISEEI